jgi:hypothetical protein
LDSSDVDNNRIHDDIRAEKDAVNSVLVSFTLGSNEKERRPAFQHFCDPPAHGVTPAWEVTCQNNVRSTTKQQTFDHSDRFHAHLSECRFAVSPFGAGYDCCYRTYEILLIGSFPIVKSSQLDGMYADWPVLIVKEWTDVTPHLLKHTYKTFMATSWNLDRLYNSY